MTSGISTSPTDAGLHVAVVGGGIAGLTAALALRTAGIAVDVYEQADAFREIGAGLMLLPQALKHLADVGVDTDDIDRIFSTSCASSFRAWDSGQLMNGWPPAQPPGVPDSRTVHRAELLDALVRALGNVGVHAGKRLTRFAENGDAVVLEFADGSSAQAEVVLGADGIKSAIREQVHGDAPTFSGRAAFRTLIPMERVDFLGRDGADHSQFGYGWLGPGGRVVTYPVSQYRLLNVAIVGPSGEGEESWFAQASKEEVHSVLAGWNDDVHQLVDVADEFNRWGIYEREPLPYWSTGRVTLLGDAAHAMAPFQSQGGNASIDDAIVLARCLARAEPDAASIAWWLDLYESIRRPHTASVQQETRRIGQHGHPSPGAPEGQDAPSHQAPPANVFGYDANDAFERALAEAGPQLGD